jgi:hypothetical protein
MSTYDGAAALGDVTRPRAMRQTANLFTAAFMMVPVV